MRLFRLVGLSRNKLTGDAALIRDEINAMEKSLGIHGHPDFCGPWIKSYDSKRQIPAATAMPNLAALLELCTVLSDITRRLPDKFQHQSPKNHQEALQYLEGLKYAVLSDIGEIRIALAKWKDQSNVRIHASEEEFDMLHFHLMMWSLSFLRHHFLMTSGAIFGIFNQPEMVELLHDDADDFEGLMRVSISEATPIVARILSMFARDDIPLRLTPAAWDLLGFPQLAFESSPR